MRLKQFLENKEVDFTKNLINAEMVKNVEKETGVSFGAELTKYVLEYGYLAYKHVEMYGVNSKQMMESDLVKQTKYLHKYYPKTTDYIALENTGDGYYEIVSSEDEVYEYSSETDALNDSGLKLFEYILERFKEVDD